MWSHRMIKKSIGLLSRRISSSLDPMPFVVQVNKLPKMLVKVPKLERLVYIGRLPDAEFKEHLKEKELARNIAIQGDEDIIQLDADVSPAYSYKNMYKDESVIKFLQSYLADTSDETDGFRVVINDWLKESISLHEDLEKLNYEAFHKHLDEVVLERLESCNFDIESLLNVLNEHNQEIYFRDLFSILISLSLWPQKFTYNKRVQNGVRTKTQYMFQELFNELDKMSNDKIFNFSEDHYTFIRDPWRRLALAKAWVHVYRKGFGGTIGWNNSRYYPRYHFNLLCKVAGNSGTNARRFFKKFEPRCLIDLAKVIRFMQTLPDDFHRYYALFKFYEFIDIYDLKEIALICKAFKNQGVDVLSDHPMKMNISTILWNRLCDSMETVSDSVIKDIDDFLPLGAQIAFENYDLLQEKALQNTNIGLSGLLRVLRRCEANTCFLNENLIEKVVQLVLNDVSSISSPDCFIIQRLITRGTFSKTDSIALNKRLLKLMEESEESLHSERRIVMPFNILFFAIAGLYSEKLCNKLRKDDRLFIEENDGKVTLNRQILHSFLNDAMPLKATLGIINGLGSYYGKDYLNISDKSTSIMIDYSSRWSPKWIKSDKDLFLPDQHWQKIVPKTPELISEKACLNSDHDLSRYVIETSILPFYGSVDFVFCLDKSNNMIPMTDSFIKQLSDPYSIKKLSEDQKALDVQWCVLSLLTHKMTFLRGYTVNHSLKLMYEIIHEIGYRTHVFYFDYGEDVDTKEVEEELKSFIGGIFKKKVP